MNIDVVKIILLFVILISIQYTLNKILKELKIIRINTNIKDENKRR